MIIRGFLPVIRLVSELSLFIGKISSVIFLLSGPSDIQIVAFYLSE